jgi:hypothetical protein
VYSVSLTQEPSDEYCLREDQFDARKEGIKSDRRIDVTSDKIALLSALAVTEAWISTPLPPVLKLGLFATNKIPASVNVFHEPKRYYVTPVRESWGPGFASFTWPSDIIQRQQVPPGELYGRAVVVERGIRAVFPICLYSGETAGAVEEYDFVVAPLRDMEIRWWIISVETDSVMVAGEPQRIGANEEYFIKWRCTHGEGISAPEGEYRLKLQGVYKPPFARKRTVSVNYRFHHKADLSG